MLTFVDFFGEGLQNLTNVKVNKSQHAQPSVYAEFEEFLC